MRLLAGFAQSGPLLTRRGAGGAFGLPDLNQIKYRGRGVRGTRQRVSVIQSTLSGQAGQRMPCVSRPSSRQASPRLRRGLGRGGVASRGCLGAIGGVFR